MRETLQYSVYCLILNVMRQLPSCFRNVPCVLECGFCLFCISPPPCQSAHLTSNDAPHSLKHKRKLNFDWIYTPELRLPDEIYLAFYFQINLTFLTSGIPRGIQCPVKTHLYVRVGTWECCCWLNATWILPHTSQSSTWRNQRLISFSLKSTSWRFHLRLCMTKKKKKKRNEHLTGWYLSTQIWKRPPTDITHKPPMQLPRTGH